MSIFMTPEQKPFYAGTYFPLIPRYGMYGFGELLLAIAGKWETDRAGLLESAENIIAHLTPDTQEKSMSRGIAPQLPGKAAELFSRSFDKKYGDFGSAPKFPTPHNLIFLTLYSHIYQEKSALQQVELTLENMRRGGIFDQIGYGFSRYSTDERFLVPHFEKMLYDNALLILAYAAAYKASGELLARIPLNADVRILPKSTDDYRLLNGRTTYYVCKNQTCLPPSNELPGK